MKKKYFWKKDETSTTKHLSFIISDKYDGKYLIVNATTIRKAYHDKSCELEAGVLPEIKVPSYIIYDLAVACTDRELLNKKFKGDIVMAKDEIDDTLLKSLQDGARKSIHLPKVFRIYFDYF